jgi:predicted transcriptional regulator
MNKVLIQCDELIDKYGFKENILKQLESMKIEKGAEDFAIVYCNDSHYTLIGEIKGNQVVLTNIVKAIAFKEMDNSDIFEFIKEQSD